MFYLNEGNRLQAESDADDGEDDPAKAHAVALARLYRFLVQARREHAFQVIGCLKVLDAEQPLRAKEADALEEIENCTSGQILFTPYDWKDGANPHNSEYPFEKRHYCDHDRKFANMAAAEAAIIK